MHKKSQGKNQKLNKNQKFKLSKKISIVLNVWNNKLNKFLKKLRR